MDTPQDPIELARQWLEQAAKAEPVNHNAMSLATADEQGRPDVRYVLLKRIDADGFEFFTNSGSAKAAQLAQAGDAALALYWRGNGRQLRARGPVRELGRARVAEYFATRSRASQIGAWASRQSDVIDDPRQLEREAARLTAEFEGAEVPLPEFWTGYRLAPLQIEFWSEGAARLHERLQFRRAGEDAGSWQSHNLYP